MSNEVDQLWLDAAARIRSAQAWSLEPRERLGRAHDNRVVWLAEHEGERLVVKVRADQFASERAPWTAETLAWLRGRGYPAPELLWWGEVDESWFALVETWLSGSPLAALDAGTLDALLALTDLQAGADRPLGGWDVSWWIRAVLFEGWEGWWHGASQAAPETAARLRALLAPAWGHRLAVSDVVHHDFGIENILGGVGGVSGVVDWDHAGHGSRALDLTSLLFDWQRLWLADANNVTADGGARLVERIVEIAGESGLRCTVCYAAIARLALSRDRGELETWRQVTESILDRSG